MKVTKKTLAESFIKRGISKKEAFELSNIVVEELIHGIKCGDGIELRGFGTFTQVVRKERFGNDIKHFRRILIPARNHIKFRASKKLISELNQKD